MKIPFVTQLYNILPKQLDFEADPNNKSKKNDYNKHILFDFTINEMSFYNAIKILPKKLDFEADPNNNLKTLMQKKQLFVSDGP